MLGCHYWATGMPAIIPGGDPILIEKVKLEITEDDDDDDKPARWHLLFWWRYASDGQSRNDPTQGMSGDIEFVGGDGFLMVPGAETGIEASTFPLILSMQSARALGVDLIENYPLNLAFERDPANFANYDPAAPSTILSEEDYLVPLSRGAGSEDVASDEDFLVPLEAPPGPEGALTDEDVLVPLNSTPPAVSLSEDDFLVPLTSAPPQTGSPDDDALAPLTSRQIPPSVPDDAFLAPLTSPR
jgi:hypothetical protein